MMAEDERTKLEMQRSGDEITNQTLESTRRMRQLTAETQNIGMSTLVELDQQGESLSRTKQTLDVMNGDLRKADKHITKMSVFCGLSFLSFRRAPKYVENDEAYHLKKGDKKKVRKHESKTKPLKRKRNEEEQTKELPFVPSITHDAREDEMEENMSEVNVAIRNLKNMATDLSNELEKQNDMLGRIGDETTKNNEIINEEIKRTGKLLRR